MKTCQECKIEKELADFGKYKKASDGLFPKCKECKKEYDKNYYSSNASRREAVAASNLSRRRTRIDFIGKYLSEHPCVDCGNSDIRVLEFNHLRDKNDNVGRMIQQVASWERIMAEIEKCEVRCANCHKIVTAERAGTWRANYIS